MEGTALSVRAYADLDDLPPGCARLFAQKEVCSLDLGLPWFRNLVTQVFPTGGVSFVVAEAGGETLAILPLRIPAPSCGEVREVIALVNYYSWLYAPIAANTPAGAIGDDAAAVLSAMFRWIAREYAPIHAIRLVPLDPASASFSVLEDGLRRAGLRPFRFFASANWYLEVGGQDWSQYLAARPGDLRSTIKRKGKRFAAEGGTLEIVFGGPAAEASIAAYEQIYAASWKQLEPYPGFIPGLIRTAAAEGWLRLGVARLNGVPISAQIWLVAHGTANIYKLAYDEEYSSYSAGTLLTAELMKHVIEVDCVGAVDFLTGDDPYKPQWMSARRERWGLVAYNPKTREGMVRLVREITGRTLRPLRDYLRTVGQGLRSKTVDHAQRLGWERRVSAVPAVVVGCCGHGLSIIRGLSRGGVRVIALESDRSLPGARTRLARVEFVPDINGPALIDALMALRPRIESREKPVLFLANDRMVRLIGSEWPRLQAHYRLSWAHCREALLPLLDKTVLEARCARQGIAYPRTFVLSTVQDVSRAIETIGFPMIVKPARPLSSFKTKLPEAEEQLSDLVAKHASELPFLVQTFIPGDDRAIHFTALYLDHGKVLARFDGHKLRSRPLGHTTVAESFHDDEVFEYTQRFFAGLELSGPVSLELKRAPDGRLWVIEPTIGRTDFWVSLCTENGVNLPLMEHRHQVGGTLPPMRQVDERVWFNEERDPFGRLWFAREPGLALRRRRGSYVFLHWNDFRPAGLAIRGLARYWAAALWRRVKKVAVASAPNDRHPRI